LALDDAEMLGANFVVFLVACFQLRANMSAGDLCTRSFYAAIIPASDRLAWKEISYETTSRWTWLDHLRFFFYHNLLLVVLILVFVTGTLQYDVLHLGYLAFALVFFRMWDTIMIRRNSIFWILRLYNFILIVASLAYQAPYFSYLGAQACSLPLGLYNIVGLYKYDSESQSGLQLLTSRSSALLVSNRIYFGPENLSKYCDTWRHSKSKPVHVPRYDLPDYVFSFAEFSCLD
jgi:hypothetical protein